MPPKIRIFLKSLHTILMRICYTIGLFDLLILFDRRPRILLYHGVTSNQHHVGIENHRRKHVDRDAFERHIAYLSAHFTMVSLAELITAVKRGEGRGCVALTFDDGYENVYVNAFPILKKYRAPITYYIVGNYIEKNEPLWVDRIEFAINTTDKKEITVSLGDEKKFILDTYEGKRLADNRIRNYAKTLSDTARLALVAHVEDLCGASLGNELAKQPDYRPSSIAELKEMQESGLVTFGGHTLTHPILSSLPPKELREEIFGSTAFIERNFAVTPRSFAYPNGGKEDYTALVISTLQEAGYTNAPITDEAFIQKDTNVFTLPRITIDNANAMYHFLFRLSGVRFMLIESMEKLKGK